MSWWRSDRADTAWGRLKVPPFSIDIPPSPDGSWCCRTPWQEPLVCCRPLPAFKANVSISFACLQRAERRRSRCGQRSEVRGHGAASPPSLKRDGRGLRSVTGRQVWRPPTSALDPSRQNDFHPSHRERDRMSSSAQKLQGAPTILPAQQCWLWKAVTMKRRRRRVNRFLKCT